MNQTLFWLDLRNSEITQWKCLEKHVKEQLPALRSSENFERKTCLINVKKYAKKLSLFDLSKPDYKGNNFQVCLMFFANVLQQPLSPLVVTSSMFEESILVRIPEHEKFSLHYKKDLYRFSLCMAIALQYMEPKQNKTTLMKVVSKLCFGLECVSGGAETRLTSHCNYIFHILTNTVRHKRVRRQKRKRLNEDSNQPPTKEMVQKENDHHIPVEFERPPSTDDSDITESESERKRICAAEALLELNRSGS